jgi:hypothetical protein
VGKKTPAKLNAHTKKRAEQRYGLTLNKDDRREIIQKIQTNQAQYVGRSSLTRSLWQVEHEGQTMNVVYDKPRHTLCTALPTDAHEFQKSAMVQPEEPKQASSIRSQITEELTRLWCDEEK